MRHEGRETERRAPIVPADAARLVAHGIALTVEESPQRAFQIADYAHAGCAIAPTGSWVHAPADEYVVGLKELPELPPTLRHRHVYFGHAYKGQRGARALLGRFAAGGGVLLDLEYLVGEDNRRLAAFGYWAGYVGAALAILHHGGHLARPLCPTSKAELDGLLRRCAGADAPRVLVIGALGRSGRGACDAARVAGVRPTRWDLDETRRLDLPALLDHDILVNTVLVTEPAPPLLTTAALRAGPRRLGVVADVTCDVASACNVLPIYDRTTSWAEPTLRLDGVGQALDVIAIDNLPSLLPTEASVAFSADLTPHLLSLGTSAPTWRRCADVYLAACDTHGIEQSAPVSEQPVSEQPVSEQPVSEQPVSEQSVSAAPRSAAPRSEALPASGTVHWVGTGLSTGSGLRVLADRAARLLLWGRTVDKAERCLARLGLTGRAHARAYDIAALAGELRAGDVVVSMLPAVEHPALVRLCVERRAHFACSSYVCPTIAAEAPAALRAGTVVLTEAGLDPGIDHLFADLLVAQAREVVGDAPATAAFTSYCGGVPATPNEFRYRFSWAPRGVLNALRAPARYLEGGAEQVVRRPWEATRPLVLDGESFEAYPNRDSLPFITQYAIPDSWRLTTFVRGTLRLDGWRQAWADVFAELRTGDDERIAALADRLAELYPTTNEDRDRVVLAVALDVRGDAGQSWSGEYRLDAVGDAGESAMARCVSLPLACGVSDVLAGAAPAGLRQAAQGAGDARRWLAFLTDAGVPIRFTQHPSAPPTDEEIAP
jgi:hypothetical protein